MNRERLRSLADIRTEAESRSPVRVAVAWATGTETLRAAVRAESRGIACPLLVGPAKRIASSLREIGSDPHEVEIVDAPDAATAAAICVARIRDGQAGILLKGDLSTALLMRAVLDPDRGLRTGRLLSDVFLFDFGEGVDRRLVGITDGGVVPNPDIDQKEEILRNAAEVFRALGVGRPRVALLAAVETVTDRFPSTIDAAELVSRLGRNESADFEVDGPLAIDLALSRVAAEMKGFESPISGRADVLLFPDLESANMSAKSVEYAAGLEPAHCIVGAKAPVLIPSRSETAGARMSSMALGSLLVG